MYGIQRRKTYPGHPQANGQAEVIVKSVKTALAKYVVSSKDEF